MPTLWKIVATRKIESPTYQKSKPRAPSGVERGVDERVGVDVLLPSHVRDVDLVVAFEQIECACVQRPEMRLLHLPPTLELLDDEHGVGTDPDRAGREFACGLESGDHRLVFGHVVRGLSDPLADRGERRRWHRRWVDHDG